MGEPRIIAIYVVITTLHMRTALIVANAKNRIQYENIRIMTFPPIALPALPKWISLELSSGIFCISERMITKY